MKSKVTYHTVKHLISELIINQKQLIVDRMILIPQIFSFTDHIRPEYQESVIITIFPKLFLLKTVGGEVISKLEMLFLNPRLNLDLSTQQLYIHSHYQYDNLFNH